MTTSKTRDELDREMDSISAPVQQELPIGDTRSATHPIAVDSVEPAVSEDESSGGERVDAALIGRMLMILESVLFVAGNPIGFSTLLAVAREVQPNLSARSARELLDQLREKLREEGRGIRLAEVAGGYQLRTPSECAPYLRRVVTRRPPRLTRATLETLAMVAYRQPMTRAEIEELRGVDCGPVLRHLLEKKLVRILGRKEEPGRPLMYGTTKEFLSLFSLKDLSSLPTLKDFVELSDEYRASHGLEPRSAEVAESAGGAFFADADVLRPQDTSAFAPVGNDEVISELADVLDEMRIRNRQISELFPKPNDQNETAGANTEVGSELNTGGKPDDPKGTT